MAQLTLQEGLTGAQSPDVPKADFARGDAGAEGGLQNPLQDTIMIPDHAAGMSAHRQSGAMTIRPVAEGMETPGEKHLRPGLRPAQSQKAGEGRNRQKHRQRCCFKTVGMKSWGHGEMRMQDQNQSIHTRKIVLKARSLAKRRKAVFRMTTQYRLEIQRHSGLFLKKAETASGQIPVI